MKSELTDQLPDQNDQDVLEVSNARYLDVYRIRSPLGYASLQSGRSNLARASILIPKNKFKTDRKQFLLDHKQVKHDKLVN